MKCITYFSHNIHHVYLTDKTRIMRSIQWFQKHEATRGIATSLDGMVKSIAGQVTPPPPPPGPSILSGYPTVRLCPFVLLGGERH